MTASTSSRFNLDRLLWISRSLEAFDPKQRNISMYYPSLGQMDALERFRQPLAPGSMVVVSGPAGVGKTMVRSMLTVTSSNWSSQVVLTMPEPPRPDTQFLRRLIELGGKNAAARTGLALTDEFMQTVASNAKQGRITTIVLDDAHHLSAAQLEMIRSILSSAAPAYPVNAVAFGEPDLVDRIGRRQLLADRVTVHHVLNPLNPDDASQLLTHRLAAVDGPILADVIDGDALSTLYRMAGGLPGALLTLVSDAFRVGMSRISDWPRVDLSCVENMLVKIDDQILSPTSGIETPVEPDHGSANTWT
ncbi:hypothetical protein BH23CHL5_BH23CHL5_27680 [soil metagenome]